MEGHEGFAGRWSLRRDIVDMRAGQHATFRGHAVLSPLEDARPDYARPDNARPDYARLDYAEEGVLQIGAGPALHATRRYLWIFDAQGVAVCFADGAPFHRFMPRVSGAGTDHPCGADLYRVRYDFDEWPVSWLAVWRVVGPRKDYEMTSVYER